MVAKMTPGIANAIRIFVPKKVLIARIAGYVHPSLPNVIKNARPTITGEMENGISIKVAKTCFPLKLNLVNKNAAMIPKNVLIDTATSVARIVTNKALLTYSVDMEFLRFPQYTDQGLEIPSLFLIHEYSNRLYQVLYM